jgi:hypothetical protein
MGDPDLRSDEMVLVRTQEVYVKSIPFEGILTNKRIVLVDRAKNLLPPKEIPLATIKDVEGGENAIRDPVVTVTVITRSGETRQMVLTFTRTAGGNRIKERDEWVKTLKENVSSSFEQVIRKVIPGTDQPQRRPLSAPSPRIEGKEAPVRPVAPRAVPKKEAGTIHPIKKIIENAPSATPSPVKVSGVRPDGVDTFCSRCGNKVPSASVFCNRCGSSIIPQTESVPQSPVHDHTEQTHLPVVSEVQVIEPHIEPQSLNVPVDLPVSVMPEPTAQKTAQRPYSPLYDNPPEPDAIPVSDTPVEPVVTSEPAPVAAASYPKPAAKPLVPRLFSPKELSPTPLNPASMPTASQPSPQKPRGSGFRPDKKVLIAVGVVIVLIILAVLAMVVYPMVMGSGSSQPVSPVTVTTTASTPVPSGTFVIPKVTDAPVVPATGIYAHISYLGSWKGTYGMPSDLQKMELSGDHYYEIVNATGPVQATFEKLDGSTRHELVVEIYKNGGLLTRGNTTAGFGKVIVSADATTGVAQAPQVVAGNMTAASKPTTNVTAVKTTSLPVSNSTTIKTTIPVTNTTTSTP